MPVEIVVNGQRAAVQNLVADGKIRTLTFDVAIDQSSWIAARILPSAHQPGLRDRRRQTDSRVAAQRRMVPDAVNQCWTQKARQIRAGEIDAARQAYDHAREVNRQRLAESR